MNLMKISKQAIIMKVVKDIFLKMMFNTLKTNIIFKIIYPFFLKIEKVEKLAANLHDKEKYGIDPRNLKQALNQGFVIRIIKFN